MTQAARRYGSVLGADVARRLIARPLQSHATRPLRAATQERTQERLNETPVADPIVMPDLTRKLEAQMIVMKAVLAAERRENASLRACIGMEDEPLCDEARVVRDRWADLVDKLLQTAV